jgi:biopolymer transport protein ExbB
MFTLADASQGTPAAGGGLWELFMQSFDAFTILLLLGSVVGVAMVFLCLFEVRERNIVPREESNRLKDLARAGRWEDLRTAAAGSDTMLARVVLAAAETSMRRNTGEAAAIAIRDAAELTASEESARWFRKIDMLNVIGNLGPLVGLAGTVWGMILAFTSLGASGGQAGPADLSLGISKALFHTLLGLVLAIPCLFAYGLYRGVVDRLCTRAIVASGEIVEEVAARVKTK